MRRILPLLLTAALAACSANSTEPDAGGSSTPLAAPTKLTATANAAAQAIDLAWSGSEGAAQYKIYRSATSFSMGPRQMRAKKEGGRGGHLRTQAESKATLVATVSETTYADADVTSGTEYFYRVTAVDDAGARESVGSNIASAKLGADEEEPVNHAPKPTASAINVEAGQTGQTTVKPGDPDADDTHTFSIVTAAAHGTATLNPASGLLVYTPENLYTGADSVKVRVKDAGGLTGDVTVGIVVASAPYEPPTTVPTELCNDGNFRAVISAITPVTTGTLPLSTPVTFTATVVYSAATTTSVQLGWKRYIGWGWNNLGAAVNLEPGCGKTTTLTGTVTIGSAQSVLVGIVQLGDQQSFKSYYFGTGRLGYAKFNSTTLPAGAVISDPAFEFTANVTYDLFGDVGVDNSWFEIDELSGNGFGYPYMAPNKSSDTFDVKLKGTLSCGDTSFTYHMYANSATGWVKDANDFLVVPVRSPQITVDNFLTKYPTNGTDSSLDLYIDDCEGARTVNLTPSAPWFSIDVTQVTLPATITVTYHGAQIPAGQWREGLLHISEAATSPTLAPVDVAVSARGYGFDFGGYATTKRNGGSTALTGCDDCAGFFDLSFAFPYENTEATRVYVNSNGTILLDDPTVVTNSYFNDCCANPNARFDVTEPRYFADTYWGGMTYFAIIALDWSDKSLYSWSTGTAPKADIYFREVTDTTGHHAEFVWWQQHNYDDYYAHHVIIARLYPNGTFTVEYPQFDWQGVETVGWFNTDGYAVLRRPSTIKNGDKFTYGPIVDY